MCLFLFTVVTVGVWFLGFHLFNRLVRIVGVDENRAPHHIRVSLLVSVACAPILLILIDLLTGESRHDCI